MEKQFNYIPKHNIFHLVIGVVVALALIIIPNVYPFGIGFKRFMILPYPYSMLVLAAIGILLLVYFIMRFRKQNILRKNPHPIVVRDGRISYYKLSKGSVVETLFNISDVSNIKYDNEDGELTVHVSRSKHIFDKDYFDNNEEFNAFMNLFTTRKM